MRMNHRFFGRWNRYVLSVRAAGCSTLVLCVGVLGFACSRAAPPPPIETRAEPEPEPATQVAPVDFDVIDPADVDFTYPDPPREGRAYAFAIAEEGEARCVIVRGADAERHVQVTADRLAAYLKLVTGGDFRVITDRTPIPEGLGAIHVGDTALPHAPGLALPEVRYGDDVYPNIHGYEIRTIDPHTLLIRGPNAEAVRYGVIGFLQRYVGVHQFWLSRLGGIGEHISRWPTLAVPELFWQDWPYFISRSMSMHPILPSGGFHLDFFRRGGSLPSSENYYRLMPPQQYGETNPEYFPLIRGERRIPPPSSLSSRWQPCVSNPEVAQVMAEAVRRHFRANPESIGYNVSVNDGHGDCTCEPCRAMDAPGTDYARRTGMSDRYVKFTNRVAELVAAEFPDRKIVFLAYSATRNPPTTVGLHPNILPVLTVDSAFTAWDRWMVTGVPQMGLYLHHNGRSHFVLPKLDVRQSARRIRYIVASGRARAFYQEMHLHWPVTGAVAYVTSRLLWDPRQDVDQLLDFYHAGLFGPAAREMRAYHDAVESGYERWVAEAGAAHRYAPDIQSTALGGSDAQFRVLNPEEAALARDALARAGEAPGLTDAQAERIALVRAMFTLQTLGVQRYWAGRRLVELPVETRADVQRVFSDARALFETSIQMRRYIEEVLEQPPFAQYEFFQRLRPYRVNYETLKSGQPGTQSIMAMNTGFAAAADFVREELGPEAAGEWWKEQARNVQEPELLAAMQAARARSMGVELVNLVSDPGFEEVGARLAGDERDLDDDIVIERDQLRAVLNVHAWHAERTPFRAALTGSEVRSGRFAAVLEHFHRARMGKSVTAEPGGRYRAGLWIRRNEEPGTYRVEIGAHLPGGGLPQTLARIAVPNEPDAWQEIVADVLAPPETLRISVLLFAEGQARDARCWVDDFFIGRYPDD